MGMTWTQIQEHMRSKYRLRDDELDMMSMVWSYKDQDRAQKIIVRRYVAFEREMIEFKSPFARRGEVDALEMIRKNSELPLATTALSGEVFIVVYNALLGTLNVDDFDFLVSRVAAVADTLEEKYASQDVF